MQYTAIFHSCKKVHFQMKIFNIFASNIDCGVLTSTAIFVLEQNTKNMYTPVNRWDVGGVRYMGLFL